jgi:hypothetical protein
VENEPENLEVRLCWDNFGPDLSYIPANMLREWIGRYGEIRVRYSANIAIGLLTEREKSDQEFDDWLINLTERVIVGRWITRKTMRVFALAEDRATRDPIGHIEAPWLDRYIPNISGPSRRFVSRLVALDRVSPPNTPIRPNQLKQTKCAMDLVNAGVLQSHHQLHPDLSYHSVVCWLHYIVDGAHDAQLRETHAEFEVPKRLDDHDRYQSAYLKLIGKRSPSETRVERSHLN